MRTVTAILLSIIVGFSAMAGDKNTSILVKQITEAQRDELPDKTIQLKLQRYSLSDCPLAKAVKELVDEVMNDDLSHTAYTLRFSTDNGEIYVDIIGLDELKGPVMTKRAWGIMTFGSACFVLLDEKIDRVFNKAKGKHTLIQEFEIVEDPIERKHTVINALWHDNRLRAKVYVIDDVDRLDQRQRHESGVTHSDWFGPR